MIYYKGIKSFLRASGEQRVIVLGCIHSINYFIHIAYL